MDNRVWVLDTPGINAVNYRSQPFVSRNTWLGTIPVQTEATYSAIRTQLEYRHNRQLVHQWFLLDGYGWVRGDFLVIEGNYSNLLPVDTPTTQSTFSNKQVWASPVGDDGVWCWQTQETLAGTWVLCVDHGQWYRNGHLHSGVDLVLAGRESFGKPIYSVGDGEVVYADHAGREWGNLIVIRHDAINGEVLYSRYGHVVGLQIKPGERVLRGQRIAEVGDASKRWEPHLHFDVVYTDLLEHKPTHWVYANVELLHEHYIDPKTLYG